MKEIGRIKELTKILHRASIAYYQYDNPIMSDKQYDEMYDELGKLEKEIGVVLSGSPTQKVQGYILKGLEKRKHSKPMLSAAKTKDINEIKEFVNGKEYYGSYKLDGLTLVPTYNNGKLEICLTRGSGDEGEIVTEQAKMISNLPKEIGYKGKLELRGECIVSWESFNYLNESLEEPFSHPRNMAAGSIRNLDTNIARNRMLEFVVFECVTDVGIDDKFRCLQWIEDLGFTVVDRMTGTVEDIVKTMKPESTKYPVDGLIFELNSRKLSESLGATSHHESCRYALKWSDETYETVLEGINWNTSRTGLINPIANFKTVNIQGSEVSKATLHNLSYIEELELGIGDVIEVYKANMIIPKIHNNLTRSNTWEYPKQCPCCGGDVEIHNENGSKTLHCINLDCQAKLIFKLKHACSKHALNIENMSEATIEFMVDNGWITCIKDLYTVPFMKEIYNEWINTPGFGKKSVDKLLTAIEKSRNTTFERFLYAQSIPLIGKTVSKDISKYCKGSIDTFCDIMVSDSGKQFLNIDGFGETTYRSLNDWYNKHWIDFLNLKKEFCFNNNTETNQNNSNAKMDNVNLDKKSFCITGKLNHFTNRDELISVIETYNGKYVSGVSSKTDYLINNDVNSTSGKNGKAKQLNIPIISEADFIKMIENN